MDHLEYSASYSQLLPSQWFDYMKSEVRKLWRQGKGEFHPSLITKRERVDEDKRLILSIFCLRHCSHYSHSLCA